MFQNSFSLRDYNSFGFDVTAKLFVEINSMSQLLDLVNHPVFQSHQRLILSGGNNVLFCNDFFDGLVVHINSKGVTVLSEDEDTCVVRAQAGEDWDGFVRMMVEKGLYGIENLAHIPGKVGAAPVQNIGAYGMEVKDALLQCTAIDVGNGHQRVFKNQECRFGYRSSLFKTEWKDRYIIVSVDFLLKKHAPLRLEYGNIINHLRQNGIDSPTLLQLHDAICEIRDAKLPDVKQIGNAGSFFKNPVVEKAEFVALQQLYPDVPSYPEPDGGVKVPAGWLIEKAGWKGWREAHVGVYEKQALVLVHYGGGIGREIVALSEKIRQSVKDKFDITITPEVNFIRNSL